MAKDTLKGANLAFKRKGVRIDSQAESVAMELLELMKEDHQLRIDDADIGNQIWRLKNKKLGLSHKLADIQCRKADLMYKLGMAKIPDREDAE